MKTQPVFVELHVLQNLAPSLLNRDDTGAHKDAMFGGVRRARVSSQCWKRAMRDYWKASDAIPESERAIRTKRLLEQLSKQLVARGKPEDAAKARVQAALGALKLQADEEGKSQYLLFLGADEVARLVDVIEAHWDVLDVAAPASAADGKKLTAKEKKDAAKKAVGDVASAVEKALGDTRSLEVRLFGRMLADLPEFNADASCQVAHALGTSALEREFDFYTAVDDLQPDDSSGADMIGQVEFASSCFYRYSTLNLSQLHRDLGGDTGLTERALRLYIDAFVQALPTGKQNSFAAHQKPGFVAVTVSTQPRALSNAFEKAVDVRRHNPQGLSLTGISVRALEDQRLRLEQGYGKVGEHRFLDLSDANLDGSLRDLATLIDASAADAVARLG